MQGHILEEWRIRDVEQKAERASSRLYELDSLRGDVGSLERADREICALIDGLRSALDSTLDRVAALERTVEELTANAQAHRRTVFACPVERFVRRWVERVRSRSDLNASFTAVEVLKALATSGSRTTIFAPSSDNRLWYLPRIALE